MAITKTLTINDRKIQYTIKRNARSLRLRLSLNRNAEVIVSAPRLVPIFLVEQFVRSKAEWVISKLDYIAAQNKDRIQITSEKQKREIRDKAIVSVLEKVKKWNALWNFDIKKITVKEQKTCWGTCNRDHELNFNWRLGLLPDHLVDYVVVHELAHLKELNHSRSFWLLVESRLPNYKQLIRELNRIGLKIT